MSTNSCGRIMVIDDDTYLTTSVQRMLERQGYCVAVNDGGPGCCNEVSRFKPHLVLIDVNMPFLSGDAFVWLFKPRPGMIEASIVLYSGIDELTLKHKARECGADGYISKTDGGLEFARKVAHYMQKSQPASNFHAAEP